MDLIFGIIKETWNLFLQMSFYLVLGFFVAGFIHIFLKPEIIFRHLGEKNVLSIVKAVLFGVPLPLCSCGVLPPAATLYKSGASKGSVIAFLSSTPVTGIDSIFATYGLLGGVFMFCRIIASILIGIVAGILVDIFSNEKRDIEKQVEQNKIFCSTSTILGGIKYAFTELYGSIAKWIFWGVFIGGVISYLVPEQFFLAHLNNRYISYLLMFVAGIPLYVCATGSIPVVATLIAKGISPGAGLIFLITGPATNTVTMLFVAKTLGRKSFIIYVITIIIVSLSLAFAFDAVLADYGIRIAELQHRHTNFIFVSYLSALVLIGFALNFIAAETRKKIVSRNCKYFFDFAIPDISCSNCAKRISSNLYTIEGIKNVEVDIKRKRVRVCSDRFNEEEIKEKLASIGYPIAD